MAITPEERLRRNRAVRLHVIVVLVMKTSWLLLSKETVQLLYSRLFNNRLGLVRVIMVTTWLLVPLLTLLELHRHQFLVETTM